MTDLKSVSMHFWIVPKQEKEIVMSLAERYYLLILQLLIMEIDTQVFELNRQVEAMYDQLDNLIWVNKQVHVNHLSVYCL